MKKEKILFIDFDSTFVTVESLDELAEIVLEKKADKKRVLAEIIAITKQGMEGKITFPQSLTTRLLLFKPNRIDLEKLINLLREKITPSIARNKAFFQENAERIYILSGGFKEYIAPIVQSFGIKEDHVLGNTLLFNKQGNVIGYDSENPLGQEKGKIKMIKKMKLHNPLIMIGDGYTDYEVKQAGLVKKFIAFVENVDRKTVTDKADVVANSFEEVLCHA